MPKIELLGIDYDNTTLDAAAHTLVGWARPHAARFVVTPNAEIAESCFQNRALYDAVRAADFVVPDGAGVVLASRVLGRPLRERIAGFDLACALLPLARDAGLSVFLLGAAPGVAEQAAQNLQARYPGLVVAGTHDGYFQDDAEIVRQIDAASPDFLFVALGFPKQELWMHAHRGGLDCGVMFGLGGSLDIFAGQARRAPRWMIRMGLEWLYRLVRQPWRFFRMMRLPKYILRALRERLTKAGGKPNP